MTDYSLVAGLSYCTTVSYSYERDDCFCRFWIDHILCSKEFSSQISSIEAVGTGAILSDHAPLSFMLHLYCTVLSFDVSHSKVPDHSPDWSQASSHSIEKF